MNTYQFTRSIRRFILLFLVVFSGFATHTYAQVDFEFWFAAPYGNQNHAPQWPEGYPHRIGGRPIYLRLATQDAPANIVVSMPANPGFAPIFVTLAPNSTHSINLTPFVEQIQASSQGNVVENKALFIRSSALITAYYEIASVLNTDIFSLKGQNALGTEFYAPMQNIWANDPIHNGTCVSNIPDPAHSYIVIAATENNTQVTITPTGDAVGISAGSSQTVILNRGQTYVVRNQFQNASQGRLGGTYITSNRNIAVTVGDDSVYPQEFTHSGDCEDYAGDQIVPTSIIGKEYIVVRGQGHKSATTHLERTIVSQNQYGCTWQNVGSTQGFRTFEERVFITATVDNTEIFINGTYYATINAGQQVNYALGNEATASYTFVTASEPVYAYHHSGYMCEMAAALLPPVDGCTGSYKMGFVRTYGTNANEEFYMNLMVKAGGENDFLLNGAAHPVIQNANFQTIIGTDWRVARLYFPPASLPVGAYYLQNTSSLFHMAMMNSTAHDWGDGTGYRLMGAMYGYFSKFSDNEATAIIVNNNDTSIVVTQGTPVSLLAGGGYQFSWLGQVWNGAAWEDLPPPYYMTSTTVENPSVTINNIGIYRYSASILTECYGLQNRSVLIRVVEPVELNDIFDTVCATTPGMHSGYNLFNLNDTIVGRLGLLTGYYVDSWYRDVDAYTQIWDDAEANRLYTGIPYYGSLSVVANPNPTGVNTSPQVLYIKKNSTDDPSGMQWYGINDQQTRLGITYRINLSTPINLDNGTQFSFDISPDGTSYQGWELPAQYNVNLILVDASGAYANMSSGIVLNGNDPPSWQKLTFDFTGYEHLTQINQVRIVVSKTNSNWANTFPGFYIDNITREIEAHRQVIMDPTNYTVTDGEVLTAKVLNYFDLEREDFAEVVITVLPEGSDARHITITDLCATSGNQLEDFDLTAYNYDVGGALIADKHWYLDAMLVNPVTNPEFVTVTAPSQTFWAFIDDECGQIGSLTIEVSPIPVVQNASVTICEIPALGGGLGIVDLTAERSKITSDAGATLIWYTDQNLTNPVSDVSQVFASHGDVYYAEVYYNTSCPAVAQLTVNLIPLSEIEFDDFAVCEDAGIVVLSATPAGGVFTGIAVNGNTFDQLLAGVGTHTITYTISNQGCTHLRTAEVTVNPAVTASIIQVPAGKLQVGESTSLQATIQPAPASQYTYTWTPADRLVSTNTLSPTTTALSLPTTYTLNVTNPTTGCTTSAQILVDVYVPVDVELQLSQDAVCAGTPVTLTAYRTGGSGPFSFNWNIPVGVDYTQLSESQIRLNNPQPNSIPVTVTVTDLDPTTPDVVSDTKTLIVYPNPTITVTPPSPVCAYSPLQINPSVSGGTPVYTHAWSQNTQIISSPLDAVPAIINTSTAGSYFLRYTVTDQNNCVAQQDIPVQIYAKPVVSASAPTVTCVGEPVQLQGTVEQGVSAGGTHSWIAPFDPVWLLDLSSTSIPNPVFETNTFGVAAFQYIFEDVNGCRDTSDLIYIQVEPKPIVTINPIADQCVSSQGVQLSANASVPSVPGATFTYNWTGEIISTIPNPILPISSPGNKTVNLVVRANNGCYSDMATIVVVVHPNPLAEITNPSPLTVCEGTDLTLRANTSQPNVTYSWTGTASTYINPTTGSEVVFNAPAILPETQYSVIMRATNTITGCSAETQRNITVYRSPEVSLGQDIELCIGWDTVLYPQIGFAVEPYSIRWLLDTTELSNTQTLNPRFTLRDNNSYQVGLRITDNYGCSGYDEISILPLQNPIANAGIDRDVDWNTPFTLDGSATAGSPAYSFEWQPQDSIVTSHLIPNPTAVLQETTQFILRVEDTRGCYDYDTVIITVIGQPISVVIVQEPMPLCYGNTATLTAIASGGSGVYTYEWFHVSNPAIVIGANRELQVSTLTDTEYGVRVSSASFDPAQATHTVVVRPLPEISIQGGSTPELCLGASYLISPQVSGTAPFTYEWSDGSPITINTPTYLYNNSQTAGTQNLTLTVTDAIGCKADITVNVTVHPLPQVTIVPGNPYVCINTPLNLQAVVSGNGTAPYVYQWGPQPAPLNTQITAVGSNAVFTASNAGNYTVQVQVTDHNSCTAQNATTVTVNPYTNLSLPRTRNVCAGQNLVLDINPTGIPGNYVMHWVGGDRNRIVDSTNILRSVFRSANEGTFNLYYTIADETGCPRRDTVTVTVYPAVTLAPIANMNACAGVSLPIEADIVEGNPALVGYSWIGNVSPTSGKVTQFNSSVPGTYPIRVLAGDQNCNDEQSFMVTVRPNPVVSITGAPLRQVDYNASVVLQGNIVQYTTAPYTFSWYNPAHISSGAQTQSPITLPIVNTRSYTFEVVDAYGCKDTARITLQTEMIIPEIVVPEDPTDDPRVPDNDIVDPIHIPVTKNTRNICIGESVRLVTQFVSGNPVNLVYTWRDDEGNFISNDINPLVTPSKMYTTYTLTITNAAGFSTSASYLVVAHPKPTANITVFPDYNGRFYIDDVFTLNGNPSGGSGVYASHAWTATNGSLSSTNTQITSLTPSSLSTINLTYRVVDTRGCDATATRNLPIIQQIIPSIIGDDPCEGTTVTYSLSRVYPPGTMFIWSQTGGDFVGSNLGVGVSSVQVNWPTATANAQVSVDIYPPNDKPLSASRNVVVGQMPQVTIAGPVHVCVDDVVNYNAINLSNSSRPIAYSWQIASDISNPSSPYYPNYWDGQDDELLIDVSLSTEQATVHWKFEGQDKVVLTARDGGCVSVVDMDVFIHALPQPDFEYTPIEKVFFQQENAYRLTDSIFKNKLVEFTNLSFGHPDTAVVDPNISFFWDMIGDGVFTENDFNTTYSYDESGRFMVQLLAVDEVWGCKNILAKPLTVVVNPNCGLTYPNAFTPDLAENNRFFAVYNEGVLETGFELRVYNRWGTLLWTTKDKTEQWDGTYKGEVVRQDVYVYHSRALCEEKDPVTGEQRVLNIKGDVTVIR